MFSYLVNGSKLDSHKHWALLLMPIIDGPTNAISEYEMGLRAQINIQVTVVTIWYLNFSILDQRTYRYYLSLDFPDCVLFEGRPQEKR